MSNRRIFILEDAPSRMRHLRDVLAGAVITHIESCQQADEFQPPYDLILLDHDLGGRQMDDHEDCGETFLDLVKDRFPLDAMVVVHSYNESGAWRMLHILRELGHRNAHRAMFGFREFNDLIEPFRVKGAA